jgi:hypothetical protein
LNRGGINNSKITGKLLEVFSRKTTGFFSKIAGGFFKKTEEKMAVFFHENFQKISAKNSNI